MAESHFETLDNLQHGENVTLVLEDFDGFEQTTDAEAITNGEGDVTGFKAYGTELAWADSALMDEDGNVVGTFVEVR